MMPIVQSYLNHLRVRGALFAQHVERITGKSEQIVDRAIQLAFIVGQ